MKVDEVIIKLCSERGYDPSQVNDYPTLLEQLECIKKLLETYPNQQYFTVKAYTYNASAKIYSFKISDVNNYGRQINVGDILIITLANGILELAQISALDTTAETGEAVDMGQLSGRNGTDGKGIENVDKLEITEGNSVVPVENGFQVDISAQFKDIAGDLITNATGYMVFPIKGGNGITVDASSDNKFLEVKVGDTIELAENQVLNIDTDQQNDYIRFGNNVINLNGIGDTWITIAEESDENYQANKLGTNISCRAAIGSIGEVTSWIPVNAYYEITGVTTSSISGTLPNDLSWTYLRHYPEQLRILFNKEFYQLADNQHTTGTLVYSHVTYEGAQLIVKTITITISTRAWLLAVVKPKFYSTAYVINIGDTLQETGEQPRGILYLVLATGASNAELQTITDNLYLPVTGYYRVGTATPAVYKTACAIDAMVENTVNVYFTDGTNKTLYYSIQDSYNA